MQKDDASDRHDIYFTEVMSLFERLCDASPAEQQQALSTIHTLALRAMLAEMLHADAQATSWVDRRAPKAARSPPPRITAAPLGPFTLQSPLGIGGMGEVWRAHHDALGLPAAVKLIRPHPQLHEGFLEAFRQEARAASQLDHPRIVTVLDYGRVTEAESEALGVVAGLPWLAMELVEGGTLSAWVRRAVPWAQLRRVLVGVLDALAHAHAREIVHLDIKPANVLLKPHADDCEVCLTDFGLAHIARGQAAGTLFGTPTFMAPEQFAGLWRTYGPWTDLYALGATAWLLLHGTAWCDGADWAPRVATPDGLEGWVRAMMSAHPRARPQTTADALRALRHIDPTPTRTWSLPDPDVTGWRSPPRPKQEVARQLRSRGLGVFGLRDFPLIGREAVRQQLWEMLDTPGIFILRGPAGVGKSRLARWLCERTTELGRAVSFRVALQPVGDQDGLLALLERALKTEGLEGDPLRRHLSAQRSSAGMVDLATALLRPTGPQRAPATGWRLLRAILGPRRLGIVWMDDVQWSPKTLQTVQAFDPTHHGPLLIVLTVQDESLAEDPVAEAAIAALIAKGADTLTLTPLAPTEQQQLIASAIQFRPDLLEAVSERTAGNPLFTIQLVRDWVDRGLLQPTQEGFSLRADARTTVLPTWLSEVWHDRLHDLLDGAPPGAARALGIAAALGLEVERPLWEAACASAGADPADVPVDLMFRRSFARLHPNGWALAHSILRETIIELRRGQGAWAEDNRACAAAIWGQNIKREHDLRRLIVHRRLSGDPRGVSRAMVFLFQLKWSRLDEAGAAEVLEELTAWSQQHPTDPYLSAEAALHEASHLRQRGSHHAAEEKLTALLARPPEGIAQILVAAAEERSSLTVRRSDLAAAYQQLSTLMAQKRTDADGIPPTLRMNFAGMLYKRREMDAAAGHYQHILAQPMVVFDRMRATSMLAEIRLRQERLDDAAQMFQSIADEVEAFDSHRMAIINLAALSEIAIRRGDPTSRRQ
ncbi:MAG: protein kinase, partial [Myxococcota bacterium]